MTQQSESTTSTTTSTTTPTTTPTTTTEDIDDPASTSPFARPLAPHPFAPPPLTEPRPLGERRCWPRSFADRLTTPLPGLKAFARFAREGSVRPGADGLADIARLPYEPAPLPRVDARTVAVSWAGHASWVVRVGGLTVLTDPVWSRRILGTPARITPVGLGWDALPRVDAVVISHNHYDHLDAPTLARLPRDTPVLVPAGLGRWFRRRRFGRVTELDWWEAAELDGVRFDFVPAHHWSKRTLTDTCRSLWGGWVLTAPDGKRLYFAGDTGYGHWFSLIGRRYPGIDLALLPIGAYDPRWWLSDVHCDPEEAVRAFQDLGAHRMAPMHWATFVLSAEPVLEPLARVRSAWAAAGLPRENLWDLPVGGSRVLP
ncbi:MBL fold metallo-hydrolase [Streptomyces europaeiscabiei]|uniref:MBL fold metallo-hydrolase n=1 Tax=Streptomyces europaeiscabiei TaxID=146819 RepID=UPI0029A695DF|nr:MBL fold metallo-hydrolase [Streptomyces europaeiscabiei]MDX3619361.1 MBL fold metallo-hydrolase [Streptomyces europaeiscabiei]WUD36568.1 MBL fold metallo-hydrolase [Streptomyces europaeiscabiei]